MGYYIPAKGIISTGCALARSLHQTLLFWIVRCQKPALYEPDSISLIKNKDDSWELGVVKHAEREEISYPQDQK